MQPGKRGTQMGVDLEARLQSEKYRQSKWHYQQVIT